MSGMVHVGPPDDTADLHCGWCVAGDGAAHKAHAARVLLAGKAAPNLHQNTTNRYAVVISCNHSGIRRLTADRYTLTTPSDAVAGCLELARAVEGHCSTL